MNQFTLSPIDSRRRIQISTPADPEEIFEILKECLNNGGAKVTIEALLKKGRRPRQSDQPHGNTIAWLERGAGKRPWPKHVKQATREKWEATAKEQLTDDILTQSQVAALLDVDSHTLTRWTKNSTFPVARTRQGTSWIYTKSDVETLRKWKEEVTNVA